MKFIFLPLGNRITKGAPALVAIAVRDISAVEVFHVAQNGKPVKRCCIMMANGKSYLIDKTVEDIMKLVGEYGSWEHYIKHRAVSQDAGSNVEGSTGEFNP